MLIILNKQLLPNVTISNTNNLQKITKTISFPIKNYDTLLRVIEFQVFHC